MKNSIKIVIIVLMAAVFALPAMAQWHTTDNRDWSADSPVATFHSTSAMQTSGSAYSSTPMIDANGTATSADAPASGRPGNLKTAIRPPITNDDPTPVGDAVLPLLLLAMAYTAYAVVRRRRKQLA